jgi:hypothetical protein
MKGQERKGKDRTGEEMGDENLNGNILPQMIKIESE